MSDFVDQIKKNDISTRYSIKAFLDRIVPSILLSAYSFYIYEQISLVATKVKIKHLFMYNFITPVMIIFALIAFSLLYKITFGRKNLVAFFSAILIAVSLILKFKFGEVKVPIEMFSYSLIPLGILSALYALYFIIFCSTSRININFRSLEIITGVLSQSKDGTDLNKIEDCDLKRSTFDMILGLSKLKITLKQKKELILSGINRNDADEIYNYIRANAFGTSTEYWTARDKQRQLNRKNGMIQEDVSADDEGEQSEDLNN
jgi:hypothetical protein